ncbi:hypothetical protein SAMN05216175_10812 [Neptunomonas qingdaonensis]|uniref:Uncharacterized protein n=1 Tax=Neptunomonas qingdaonensis TaxID=1045558 RepID=A0A1I2SHE4_9GAMM|nr:hypothetical protein SAMN05216175_10812 [Neptunomonas qingdaonensis]
MRVTIERIWGINNPPIAGNKAGYIHCGNGKSKGVEGILRMFYV